MQVKRSVKEMLIILNFNTIVKYWTGGLFLNFIIGTILDFPAKTLAMILVEKVGRKYPYMGGSFVTGT